MTLEDLKAIGDLMDQKLAPVIQRLDGVDKRLDGIDKRLDNMEERLERLEESSKEVRSSVNSLIDWAEKVSMAATFPLPDIDD